MPEEIGNKAKAFYDAMDKEDYSQAKIILNQLVAQTAPEYPLITDMKTMYEIETGWPED